MKKKGEVYLDYYQAMILIYKITEMRAENPFFDDAISKKFENYVIERTREMLTYPPIKLRIIPGANKYIISESMFHYLCRLTGVNPFDKNAFQEYMNLVKRVEERAYDSLSKNRKSDEEEYIDSKGKNR